jgi:F0F1-type ATP synthase epsilon subunit
MEPKYEDAQPYILSQHEGIVKIDFPSFDQAIDEYYAKFEEQKLSISADSAEQAIKARVEKIRQDQEARIETLEAQEGCAFTKCFILFFKAYINKCNHE